MIIAICVNVLASCVSPAVDNIYDPKYLSAVPLPVLYDGDVEELSFLFLGILPPRSTNHHPFTT